ncbi:MAG: efflux RND transporter periplasmic adaptor subunit, partial [Candidatus Krumholzibacteria bacterium]|nr:efflux RND transporter periplasmic adaptor subunit [Candidatus Krumholzibacteria bacterium]
HGDDLIILSTDEMREFNIQVAEAGPGEIVLTRSLPGEVKVNGNRIAHIVPRYSGIVTEVRVQVGDTVKEEQVLAMIEGDESLAPYEMITFIAGTIIEKHMTLGEPVSRENEGFVVADLNTVWIDITVYLRDLDLIKVGNEATVRAGAKDGTVSGKISYVTPVVDEHTRTATARMVVDNPDGYWRPGMFVMAEIRTGQFAAEVVVPSSAVHTLDGHPVVFVEEHGGFEPRPVDVGRKNSDRMEIVSGLEPGERYVTVGGFTLKAELGKDSLGDGHAH